MIGAPYYTSGQVNCGTANIVALRNKHSNGQFFSVLKHFVYLILSICVLGTLNTASHSAPLPMRQIAQGVYAFEGQIALMAAVNFGKIANVGFIVGQKGVAVIDTGGSPEEGRALLEAITQVTDLPVRWVINTHMHPDHVFGNAAFMGPDVAFIGHINLAAALEERFPHYLEANRAAMGDQLIADARFVRPNITVSQELSLDIGGRVLDIRAWSVAHTNNDLTVYDNLTQTLFTGDLVFHTHAPSLDGSLRGWQKVMLELNRIPAQRAVPGHGPVPSPWPVVMAPQSRYFDVLVRDIRDALGKGQSLAQALPQIGRSEAANWLLFDEFNARNATAAFAELEWE